MFRHSGGLGTRRARTVTGLAADNKEDEGNGDEDEGKDDRGAIDRLLFDELFHHEDKNPHRAD
ncbi:MAG: hypothetical protein ABIV48_03005 [Pyrinomonadaceae bacterium]